MTKGSPPGASDSPLFAFRQFNPAFQNSLECANKTPGFGEELGDWLRVRVRDQCTPQPWRGGGLRRGAPWATVRHANQQTAPVGQWATRRRPAAPPVAVATAAFGINAGTHWNAQIGRPTSGRNWATGCASGGKSQPADPFDAQPVALHALRNRAFNLRDPSACPGEFWLAVRRWPSSK